MKNKSVFLWSSFLLSVLLITACDNLRVVDFRITSAVIGGQDASFVYTVKNVASTHTYSTVKTSFYLSYDRVFSNEDILLKTTTVSDLTPDEYFYIRETLAIPSDIRTGSYYIVAVDEEKSTAIPIVASGLSNDGIDLVPTNVFFTHSIIGGFSDVVYQSVYNAGTTSSEPTDVRYFLSDDAGNTTFVGIATIPAIEPSHSAEIHATLLIPETVETSTYTLRALVDITNKNQEFDETNNVYAKTLRVRKQLPNLVLRLADEAPLSANLGESILVDLSLENAGQIPIDNEFLLEIFLSSNNVVEEEDIELFSLPLQSFQVDQFASAELPLNLPTVVEEGSYYIIAVVNRTGHIEEVSTNDNLFRFRICLHDSCSPQVARTGEETHLDKAHDHAQYMEDSLPIEKEAIYLEKSQPIAANDLIEKVKNKINIYPNPAQQRTHLSMELIEESDIQVEVMTMSGVVLKSFQGKYDKGASTKMLDLNWVPSGSYLVKVRINEEVLTEKVVIQ